MLKEKNIEKIIILRKFTENSFYYIKSLNHIKILFVGISGFILLWGSLELGKSQGGNFGCKISETCTSKRTNTINYSGSNQSLL